MQAIQLDLFTGKLVPSASPVIREKEEERSSSVNDICPRGTISSTLTLDPCRGCPLRGLCPSDDCAMHLYELDDQEENYTPFEDWLSEPL